jgi:hypothetical protein
VTLYTAPPPDAVVVCLDELGPVGVRSYPGARLIPAATAARPRPRATQEVDYGRRGGGFVFGAFVPATGAAYTAPFPRRTGASWVDFLAQVDAWLAPIPGRIYAVLDNLPAHRTTDALLFAVARPRWEFVFQPTCAAYLNLIEPWWAVLRSLALAGRRFADWAAVTAAVAAATTYWNAHRHPFVWGRRHPPRRKRRLPGVGHAPAFIYPTN